MGVDPISSVTSSAICSERAATSRVERVIGQLTSVAAPSRPQPGGTSIGSRWRPVRGSGGRHVRFFAVWIVAGAGAHDELAVAFRPRFHMNHAETTLRGRLGGMVANGVLLTDIACNLRRDFIHLGE